MWDAERLYKARGPVRLRAGERDRGCVGRTRPCCWHPLFKVRCTPPLTTVRLRPGTKSLPRAFPVQRHRRRGPREPGNIVPSLGWRGLPAGGLSAAEAVRRRPGAVPPARHCWLRRETECRLCRSLSWTNGWRRDWEGEAGAVHPASAPAPGLGDYGRAGAGGKEGLWCTACLGQWPSGQAWPRTALW